METNSYPKLGLGVGLRPVHYKDFFEEKNPVVDWVEVISENYMTWKSFYPKRPLEVLEQVREHVPVLLHGVSLSIGSVDPVDKDYLKKLKELARIIEPAVISDHLCWTGVRGENLHDLLPLPYTREAVELVAAKIHQVQDFLGRPLLLENISSYVSFSHSEMSEWEFLNEVTARSGCGLLLDVNNIYVNAINHGFDALKFLNALPVSAVGQIHLAGHSRKGSYLVDTHDEPVCDEVWELYRKALARFGKVSTMIEWDAQIPAWSRLMQEVTKIKSIQGEEHAKADAGRSSTSI